jgi:2-dehydro-3-deoxygluconokinase
MAADIIALGEPLIEFVATGQTDEKSPLWRQSFGGDTSNAIIAAARQGARTGYLTAVGNDMFGDSLLELWRREGVATTGVVTRQDDPTGAYFVQPHASGRSFTCARRGSAASLYAPPDLPHQIISQARILHVSALSQAISPTMRLPLVWQHWPLAARLWARLCDRQAFAAALGSSRHLVR